MNDHRPAPGEAGGQPFPEGLGGSKYFRIPAIVALSDGTLVAACDARWDHWGDGGGLDTVVSVSSDGGKSWHYSFPNYLGDNGNTLNDLSTAFIDPALATDGKRVWMLVDLYPGGIALNTARYRPVPGKNGFDEAGHLLLRSSDPIPVGEESYAQAAAQAEYDHYLDLKTLEVHKVTGEKTGYKVSPFFDIGDSNIFRADAPLRVYPTNYLYLTCSDDGGKTWSAPELLNLKRENEESFLVGPGNGAFHDGKVIFSAYEHTLGFERCCLIWKDEKGWHRSENATRDTWSSEGAPVVLPEGTVRLFYRDGFERIRYTDYAFDGESYIPTAMEAETDAPKTAANQLSALRVGERIFVSAATGPDRRREKGAVHVFRLAGNKMELEKTVPIWDGFYAYSSLAPMKDGRLALLYESAPAEISFTAVEGLEK